jgi:cell division protein FtsQ
MVAEIGTRAPRERRYRGFIILGAAFALVVAAIGGGGYALHNSSLFRVKTVEVEGAVLSSPNQLAAEAGLFRQSLLTADLAAATQRLRAMPLVKDAHIERRWPNTVRITVIERTPWGVWEQDGVPYTIDRDGVVLGTTYPAPPNAPVIKSSEKGTRLPGERVDHAAVDAASRIWTELPGQLGVEVTEVAFLAGMGVRVTTGDGQIALLGDASGIDYKLAAWAAMAGEARAQGIAYTTIDLRFGNRPVLVQ